MPEQRRQGGNHQDQRQNLKGEHEQRAPVRHRIGLGPATQIAEHKLRALGRRGRQTVHGIIDPADHGLGLGHAEQ